MGLPAVSFRPNIDELRALRVASRELGKDKSTIIRAALHNFLNELQEEELLSYAPPARR